MERTCTAVACVNLDRAKRSRLKAERFILFSARCHERRKQCDVKYSVSHWCTSPDCVSQRRKVPQSIFCCNSATGIG